MDELTLEKIEPYFVYPKKEVHVKMGIRKEKLDQFCRENNIKRWPNKKILSINNIINELELSLECKNIQKRERSQLEKELEEMKVKKQKIIVNPNIEYSTLVSNSILQRIIMAHPE